MKASDYIVEYLKSQGIKYVFGYIGGMITHIVDSLDNAEGIDYIQTYHEQTAAIAAEGYSIETKNFGVAISTSGPGVTNMITGIADAYFDSIPTLFISGQVNTHEYKYDLPIRQRGFQEMDVVSLCKPITKYANLVDDVSLLRYELEKAIHIAKSPRMGPVILDIPMNIQRMEIEPESMLSYSKSIETLKEWDKSLVVEKIKNSKRPILLVGGGIRYDKKKEVTNFLDKFQIPVVNSLLGKGFVDEDYHYYLGMIGSYGNRCANIAIAKSDLIICIGSRLDTRQTGANFSCFEDKTIIHVDIDIHELESHKLKNRILVNAYSSDFLNIIAQEFESYSCDNSWLDFIVYLKENYNQGKEIQRFVENKMPYLSIQTLNHYSKNDDVFTVDIGQNQMWAAQTLKIKENQTFITSGGLAPMGYSIPCAIGHGFANSKKRIMAIVGDGGFMISEQSLYMISQYDLNVLVILLNNSSLGMITQFQTLYFNSNMAGTTIQGGYRACDARAVALSHGLRYFLIEEKNLNNRAYLDQVFSSRNGVIEFRIENLSTVSPKLEFDQPIYNPFPYLPEDELKELLNRI